MPECACDRCQMACRFKPGWFRPGEAEKAAQLLDMPLQEFFDKYLGADFVSAGTSESTMWGLSPAVKEGQPGQEFQFRGTGECVFYENGRCKIHAAKPSECAMHMHTDTPKLGHQRKWGMVQEWKQYHGQIVQLLGREPVLPEPTSEDMVNLLLDRLFGRVAVIDAPAEPAELIVPPW